MVERLLTGRAMLSDREVAGSCRLYPNFNTQLTPRFHAGRAQFTAEEIQSDLRICQLRYTYEVAMLAHK
jgi:hypothetical protein